MSPAIAASAAAVPRYRAGEVVVRYGGAHAASAGAVPRTRVLQVPKSVAASTRARCASRPDVLSATANYVAHVSGWVPPDPGNAGVPAGWQQLQWNFLPETGVNAPDAWQHLIERRPARRRGRDGRGGGHRDRLRQPRALPALAGLLAVPLRRGL